MRRLRMTALWLVGGFAARLLAAQSATCPEPGFVAPDRYSVPDGFGMQVAADVTGDGRPDLVGLQGGALEPAIVVLPGLADGGFGSPVVTPIDSGGAMVVADFTGEGTPDVLVSQNSYPFFGILLFAGNGDGSFQAGVKVVDFTSGGGLQTADVDGDGKNDIIVSGGPWIEVFLNEGAGSFTGPFRTPAWSPGFVLGEVNGDGILDVVGTRSSQPPLAGGLVYYPGRGDGTFDPSHDIAPGDFQSVQLGDLNGDGHLDVVAASGFTIVAVLGHGDGTFEPAVQSFAPPGPQRFRLADLNSDGFLDIVIAQSDYPYSYATDMDVMLGAGDGGFRRGQSYAVRDPFFVIADFGNDGRPDVAVQTSADPDLYVFRGNGDGSLRGPRQYGLNPIFAIVSGDFNEDGRPDIADVFYYVGTTISYSFGGPRGDFAGGGTISLNVSMSSLATADVNGDGHLDLATLNTSGSTMPVLLGDGHGNFSLVSNTPVPAFYFQSRLQFADLDGDGKVDAIALNTDPNAHSDQIVILPGNGDGTFGAVSTISLPTPGTALTIADATGDGVLDLIAAGSEPGSPSGSLYLMRGLGNGTFASPTVLDTGASPAAVVVGDFVEDGHVDLAVGDGDNTIWIYPGLGAGDFDSPIVVDTVAPVLDLAAADFQEDGHLDLFATSYPRAFLLYGDGQGGFAAPQQYPVGAFQSQSLLTGDFDGNGTTDVIASDSSFSGGGFVLLQNAVLAVHVAGVVAPTPGEALTLVAEASGLGQLVYEWRRDGVPLSDGGSTSGSKTAVLTIDPVSFTDAGSYDVVVTDSCGSVTSNATPLSVEFADVPISSPFHDDIITIATEGITGGCGGGNYCPTSPVRRDQMAVFLLKSEHGSSYTPPACAGVFADVPCPSQFADWVEQLAAEGVTGGCGGGNYCPTSSVTRAQMAIFLLKTSQGSSYTPPPAVGIFGDVPVGSFGADFIEDLYNRGITGGCQASPLLYCPGNVVLRQQMATFLVRTFLP